ncbi:TPA: hypothetical protein RQK66_002637 [Vibrio vulnificus]|uniref:hypothetical protein n=1 Tax=Vibrio parahaemolyticus TaxID=670 RepID=UPI001C5D5B4A
MKRAVFKVWGVGWLVSDFILKKEIILRLLNILKEVGTLSGLSDVSSEKRRRFIKVEWTAHQLVRF